MKRQDKIIAYLVSLGGQEIGRTPKYVKVRNERGEIYYVGQRGAVRLKTPHGMISLTDKFAKLI